MILRVVVAFVASLSLASGAVAQGCSGLVTLTNGTNADATQVMSNFNTLLNCINAVSGAQPQGRLTLVSTVPVMTASVTPKTTIFYTPYLGNIIPINNGTGGMVPTTFAELSVATTDITKNPSPIGANKVNDWFVWNDGGTIRLSHGPDWASDTLRAAGNTPTLLNGVLVNNAAITNGPAAQRGTYVGTTRSDGSSHLNWSLGATSAGGTAALLYVWNYYNRVLAVANVSDSNANWTVPANTVQAMDVSVNNRVSFVSGAAESAFVAQVAGMTREGAGGGFSGMAIGFDSISAISGNNYLAGATGVAVGAYGIYSTAPFGAHFVQAMDANQGTVAATNFGNGTLVGFLQGGLTFNFMM